MNSKNHKDEQYKAFVNNNDNLRQEEGQRATFLSGLFSRSLWLPKLKGASLVSSQSSLSSPEPEVIKEIQTAQSPSQEPTKPSPVSTPAPANAASAPGQQPEKAVESNKGLGGIAQYIPGSIEAQKEASATEYKIDANFEDYLKSINLSWSVSQITGIDSFKENVDVLFFGLDEISLTDLPDTTPISLIESEQDLLGKMIKAMNLKEGSFVRIPLIKSKNELEFLLGALNYFKPRVIVPLGATSTNIVLERKVKLSNVHGQLEKKAFKLNGDDHVVDVSPLFHPQLLEINQSMKRTAWIDMQKLMEFIGNN